MKQNSPLVSLIVPLHNESENLTWHYNKMSAFLSRLNISYELIYIDDGSTDSSLTIIKNLSNEDERIRFISFPRNFGKEAATTAGLYRALGDVAVIIDADGQHPIESLEDFLAKWQEGYKVVVGQRSNTKGGGFIKHLGSKSWYLMLRTLGSSDSARSGLTDFRLIDRQVIDEFKLLTEHGRVTRNLIDWLGFKRAIVPFVALPRHAGKPTYTLRKLVKMAVDGIVRHSTRPLKFIGLLGALVSLVSVAAAMFLIVEQYILGDPLGLGVTGAAIIAIFLSFMIGIVLLCQGLLALYLESVYYETQNRPLYVVAEES